MLWVSVFLNTEIFKLLLFFLPLWELSYVIAFFKVFKFILFAIGEGQSE